ncbi:EFR1 family ferrodoxin [Chitinivibrio alkaliphilus]|uniref:4Fe-4S ferredoxin iron-sulfur binding domain protein n=1 Tax=Chitinivibrio alkaliphilus ACht1 TaxID=1313304 RepID=U7D925_9BACT|nr:EFR1 family ferrodoxin [Chitinivibrio alkaliphilus]ERP32086.1 4Fe-4S ferredoxin iron-sulfur binding domain protein [Chitinivibrio alkaliphilus ACht1]
MSTQGCVYYFSATGNSLSVARRICEGIPGFSLHSIAEQMQEPSRCSTDAPIVGIVFPVYLFSLPRMVARFLRHLRLPQGCRVFFIATYGSYAGAALHKAHSLLARQHPFVPMRGAAIRMVDTYIPFFFPPSPQKIQGFIAAEEKEVNRCITAITSGALTPIRAGVHAIPTGVFSALGELVLPWSDYALSVSSRRCTSCGRCQLVCPSDNIFYSKGIPRWKHRCEHCLACVHWCPVGALRICGRRWQYHHPEIDVDDICTKRENVFSAQ